MMHCMIWTYGPPNWFWSLLSMASLFTSDMDKRVSCPLTLIFLSVSRDSAEDSGACPSNKAVMDITLFWMGSLERTLLLGHESATEIYSICVSNILLNLSWFCIAIVKLSILASIFSKSFLVAWNLLPKSLLIFTWSLMISLREDSFLLKFWPLLSYPKF
jgi:hypothetical protein